ncbi:MAG TPA: SnoaL-like domain-containing protein [Tepidisphaeraceae bacterium]|nr:SnoaL-like domain-containing protein [Tepidisphaeraceae bacterium]
MASAYEVGQKLVALCKEGKNLEAIQTLYAPNIVSIEVHGDAKMPARMEGLQAALGKNKWWVENHTVHSANVQGPFPHGDRFIDFFMYDVTAKAGPMAGKRMKIEEAALYTVADGKVTQEEFFYHMG